MGGLIRIGYGAALVLQVFSACSSSSSSSARPCWNESDGCYCDDNVTKETASDPFVDQCSAASVGDGAICCSLGATCVCGQVGCLVTPGIACSCSYRVGHPWTTCSGSEYTRCCKDNDSCG